MCPVDCEFLGTKHTPCNMVEGWGWRKAPVDFGSGYTYIWSIKAAQANNKGRRFWAMPWNRKVSRERKAEGCSPTPASVLIPLDFLHGHHGCQVLLCSLLLCCVPVWTSVAAEVWKSNFFLGALTKQPSTIREKEEKSSFAKSPSLEFESRKQGEPLISASSYCLEFQLIVLFLVTSIYKLFLDKGSSDLVSLLCCILADMKSKPGLSSRHGFCSLSAQCWAGHWTAPLMLKHERRPCGAGKCCRNSGCSTEPWFQTAELFYRDFIFSADISTINQNFWFIVENSQHLPVDVQWPLVLAM